MLTIFKGAASNALSISIASGRDYSGVKLVMEYQSARREFTNLTAGGTVSVSFTAEETARFAIGTYTMALTLVDANGGVTTVGGTATRIRVTDDPDEVSGNVALVLSPSGATSDALAGVTGLDDGFTDNDVKTKLNTIIGKLGGTVSAVALALGLVLSASGAGVQTEVKGMIPNTNRVVTAVNFDGLASEASVTNVVTNVVTKAFVEGLGITGGSGGGGYVATNGTTVVNDDFKIQYNSGPTLAASSGGVDIIWKTSGANFWNFGGAADQAKEIVYHETEASLLSFGIYYDSDTGDWKLTSENREGVVATVDDIEAATNAIPRGYITDGTSTINADRTCTAVEASHYGILSWTVSVDGETGTAEWDDDSSTWSCQVGSRQVSISPGDVDGDFVLAAGGASMEFIYMDDPDGQVVSDETVSYTLKANYAATVTTLLATTNDVSSAVSPIMSSISALSSTQAVDHVTISAWQTYWDGDDVRLTITNYYGSSGLPHLYLEEKMSTNETHTSTWFKVVWDEMARWTNFTAGYSTFTNNAIQNYADRAWGSYDSATGEYSPEGVLQVSQPNIMIAAGLAYQKTVTANGGAVWVLTATDPTLIGGQTENGFLNITDGDGNSLMRIVKGDRRTVGATATAIDVQSGAVKVAYNCVADEHPILQAATNLTETFATEASGTISVGGQSATVAWTGTSGAYTGTVTFATMPPSAFFRATYETGGETYISNSAPISVSSGILCTDGVHKCRPVYSNGSITWEVVQ